MAATEAKGAGGALREALFAAAVTLLLCTPIIMFRTDSDPNDGTLQLAFRPIAVAVFVAIAFVARSSTPAPWHPDGPVARARELRREATAACEERRIAECESKLDDARDLDPAGESLPEVQVARATIADAIARDARPPRVIPDEGKPRRR